VAPAENTRGELKRGVTVAPPRAAATTGGPPFTELVIGYGSQRVHLRALEPPVPARANGPIGEVPHLRAVETPVRPMALSSSGGPRVSQLTLSLSRGNRLVGYRGR